MNKFIIAIVLLLASNVASAYPYTVEITKNQLQSKLSSMMPIERKKYGVLIRVSRPVVDLAVGNNEAGVFAQLDVVAPGGLSASGTTKITGSLRYDPQTYEVFFKNPQIVSLEMQKVPSILLPQLKKMVRVVIDYYLSGRPVYTVTNPKLKQALARVTLKGVTVRNNKIKVELDVRR